MNQQITDYFRLINYELNLYNDEITDTIQQCVKLILSAGESSPAEIEHAFEELAQSSDTIETIVYFYSVAIFVRHSAHMLDALLDFVLLNREKINLDTLHYLYGQFKYLIFAFPETKTLDTYVKIWKILDYMVCCYETALSDLLIPISEDARNDEFVLVLTEQFISFLHGPTKTAADRCKILMEYMGKTVLLLNTAESMSTRGEIPFFDCRHGNYNEDWLHIDQIEWKSCRIPYFQCDKNMPDINMVRILLSMIRRQRPAYIISIGTGGITAALASRIVPTLSIGLLPSALSITGVPFQTLSRPLNDDDRELLLATGRPESSVIIGTFGSSILEQKTWRTRESVGLPPETWLAATVGGRLNQELDSAFWDMAEKASVLGIEFVILGSFSESNLDNAVSSHPSLKGRIHPMGVVEDVLSYLDLCDMYINPIRAGGGTSCVEAMSLGLPVITTAFGDVAVNAGEPFQTESYDTMPNLLKRYISDFDFYQAQCLVAKKRAAVLLNAEQNFAQIVSGFLERANHSG